VVPALAALTINLQYTDLSNDWRTYQRAERIFETVEPNAYVLAVSWFEAAPLEYLQVTEGQRPDIKILKGNQVSPPELEALVEVEIHTHPFYSTANADWLAARYNLEYIERCHCYQIEIQEESRHEQ
jgi:hypothetical protein